MAPTLAARVGRARGSAGASSSGRRLGGPGISRRVAGVEGRRAGRRAAAASASASAGQGGLARLGTRAVELMEATIRGGKDARVALEGGGRAAVLEVVRGVLTDLLGVDASVGDVRLFNDGVVVDRVCIGDDVITARSIVLRANLQPLAAVLSSWREVAARGRGTKRTPPPVLINKIIVQGVKANGVTAAGVLRAYSVFGDAPGTIHIDELVLRDVELQCSKAAVSRPACIKRMEFSDLDSRMALDELCACITHYEEPAPEGGAALALRPNAEPTVWDKMRGAAEGGAAAAVGTVAQANPFSDNIGPQILTDVASLVARGAVIADAGLDVLNAAAGTEVLLDTGILLALVAQGVPSRVLTEGGGAMWKMVETGVAGAMLERGSLVKEMVDRRVLDTMLELKLLDLALERPEMVKALIRDGCLSGLVENGVLEAMLFRGEPLVLKGILGGNLVQVITDTELLKGMFEITAERAATRLQRTAVV